MIAVYSSVVDVKKFSIPETDLSGDTNKYKITFSDYGDARLDLSIEVSYDGDAWCYGGGCGGAQSASNGTEFHISYPTNPKKIRGSLSFDKTVTSEVKIFSGE